MDTYRRCFERVAARPVRLLGVAAVVAVGMVVAGCGGDAGGDARFSAAPDAAPATLLERVPEPGEPQPPETVEFAGPSAGGPNVALLSDLDGNVVLYACDGATYGELFEGTIDDGETQATFKGTEGGVIRLDLSGAIPTGVLERDGASYTFALTPADESPIGPAGFYRHVDGDRTSAWVVAGDGSVKGIGKEGVEITGGIDGSLGDGDVVDEGFPPPPPDNEAPALFKKRRCAKLAADLNTLDDVAVDLFAIDKVETANEILEFMAPLQATFDRLGCSIDLLT